MRFPNLYLVGAPKCGTTTMAYCLSQHPDIYASINKEPFYFGSDFNRARPPLDDYLGFYGKWERERYALDATTKYFYSTTAAEEIKQACPDARIIAMTRDPIEAAWSLFNFCRFIGREPLRTFEASLRAETERANTEDGRFEHLLYSRIYDFPTNIARYERTFGKERVHVLSLEAFHGDHEGEMAKVWEFLELEPYEIDYSVKNVGDRKPRIPFLSAVTYEPPEWAGRMAFFIPKATRLRIRHLIQKANSTINRDRPELTPEMREFASRHFMQSGLLSSRTSN